MAYFCKFPINTWKNMYSAIWGGAFISIYQILLADGIIMILLIFCLVLFSVLSGFASYILKLCCLVYTHVRFLCLPVFCPFYKYLLSPFVPGNYLCSEVYYIWYYSHSCFYEISVCMVYFSLFSLSIYLYCYMWDEFLKDST